MTNSIARTLHLKYAHFRSGHQKNFVAPRIDDLILSVAKNTPKFSQRHFPPPGYVQLGTACAFIENIRKRKSGDGVYFEVSSYTFGLESEQFQPNFNLAKPDINKGPIKDQSGHTREILHSYRCLAFGQSLIVEFSKGAGGISLLEHMLSYVFNQHSGTKLPGLALLDVTTNDLAQAIQAGGGADSISVRLIEATPPPKGAYVSNRLNDLRNYVKKSRQVDLTWSSDDLPLDSESIMNVAHEFDDHTASLEKMSIKLKNGGSIPSLAKYRERRRIDVGVSPEGAIMVSEIETGLGHYLDELRQLKNGWRVIDDKGNFTEPKILSSKA